MGSKLKEFAVVTRCIGFDTTGDLFTSDGSVVPVGIARTIQPPPNSRSMEMHTNLAAREFFTNYDEDLIRQVREHKISSGVWC